MPFGHKLGDFPVSDWQAANKLSLPCHEHLEQDELVYIADKVKEFYDKAEYSLSSRYRESRFRS